MKWSQGDEVTTVVIFELSRHGYGEGGKCLVSSVGERLPSRVDRMRELMCQLRLLLNRCIP